jgi:DNA primase
MKGKLSNLIKKYGGSVIFNEYIEIINEYKSTQLFTLNIFSSLDNDICNTEYIKLPPQFKPIKKGDTKASDAIHYLNERGINWDLIQKYNIGYIGNDYNKDFLMKNRIIIPSYNEYNDLNYWVGRDYTGQSKLRYKNPKFEKKNFIFNEKYINWYEDITLVEGVFDHIVVPNSIPLLGKNLDNTFIHYNKLIEKSRSNINVFLDDDALTNAKKIYKILNNTNMKNRIKLIECPNGYDASQIYQEYGSKGIVEILRTAKTLNEYDLLN